jgi:hypothetical protein
MANNIVQVKRTSVAGRTPNTTNSGNSQYINAGELALNMPDSILYTSNGTALITVGANVVNQNITGNLTVKAIIANSTLGTAGQVLTTNSTGVYWSTVSSGSGTVTSVATGNGMTGGPITTTGTVSILANTGIVANATGTYVNATYIGTLTANNANFVNGKTESNLNVNSAVYANQSITNTFTVGTSAYFVSNGNLGVGNSTPASRLHFQAATSGDSGSSNGVGSVVYIKQDTGWSASQPWALYVSGYSYLNGFRINAADGTRSLYKVGAGQLGFATTGNDPITFTQSDNIERVRIAAGGNVGIGNTAPDAKLSVTGTANVSGNVVIGGITTFSANVVLGTSGLSANGGFGTAGHTLHSNGTATYWAVDDQGVTSVATGNGMTGGAITTTGTVSILANTGIVANSTGAFVNATYIGTISSNNASFLGGTAAAAYVQNTDSRTLSGNLVFSGANVNFTGNARITGGLIANGSLGTANNVLTSNGSSVYWAEASGGGGSSNAVYMKGGAATIGTLDAGGSNIFRVNANTLNYNTTIASGENASATGPIAVAGGVTLTVQTGARVSIV